MDMTTILMFIIMIVSKIEKDYNERNGLPRNFTVTFIVFVVYMYLWSIV